MADEEYIFSDKQKMIDNLIKPFFQNISIDTTVDDYLLILKECILKLGVFKNPIFETLQLNFPYTEVNITPQFVQLIPTFPSTNQLSAENALIVIFNAAFSYFNMTGEFISILSSVAPAVLQIFEIPDNDFFNNFYSKLNPNKRNDLQKSDFDNLNSLIFYYIIKFLADCIYIQITPPPGTPIILNVNSEIPSQPPPILPDILLNQNIILLETDINEFYRNLENQSNEIN